MSSEFPLLLASASEIIPLVAIGGGISVAIVAIVAGTVRRMVTVKHREESRREIAAYVAEGTMSPADAERLLEAGMKAWERPQRRNV